MLIFFYSLEVMKYLFKSGIKTPNLKGWAGMPNQHGLLDSLLTAMGAEIALRSTFVGCHIGSESGNLAGNSFPPVAGAGF